MHYEISRGYQVGKQLTKAQRTSGTFAEEPVVLGKVLRRGMKPFILTEDQFGRGKAQLLRLLVSGSIRITVVDAAKDPSRIDYKDARAEQISSPPAPEKSKIEDETTTGDATGRQPSAPASMTASGEELEVEPPPSSKTGEGAAPGEGEGPPEEN